MVRGLAMLATLALSARVGVRAFTRPAMRPAATRMFCSAETPAAAPKKEEAPAPRPDFDFSVTDIRVGVFTEAWHHEDSDKLFCEKIDVGEEEPRQIVSGLRAHYELSDLEERRCLVVCNLKKAKLGGVESFGMVLCGSNEDGKVEFVEPPAEAEIGERVFVEGMEGEPFSPNQVKKKKAWENVSPNLKVIDGTATFKGEPIMTTAGACTTPTVTEGRIS
uniref:tRNA-binding domain-containing protein n=1 Tax=Phaeomonas parva TaxID=124430 RepID=A0A7S1UFX4_9STRA|mmetsp:Transcript_45408/g.142329  ORF Transcript_45408/g.142329 Transcript_45408/m.142329 type:complete len:220 (+) Transcript_45408:48-707(+)|eukprot:CAMPEP_0118883594 /NCGR_PEP_ID=MMETSP1163-20130328/22630_1 /TAXON_ID=124430 /ORGANISM="Phaeomonas parva, Strain CCMP2877" /LENGTH=219 /DNA_ID=CAMNT_0006821063 /DNA_START=25 /DNA_END=684 /DNA_ORIENTATION=+